MIIDYTLILVLQGAVLLGVVAGMAGVFALLRQQSLLGDALSHAALPGIVLMFLCTYSKNPWVLLTGGALVGLCGTWMVNGILAYTTLKKDAVLGILLSVFFGIGLVLMTVVQKYSVAEQAILNKFLFGNVATLLPIDITVIKIISSIIVIIMLLWWKELSLYAFDPFFCHSLGFSTRIIEFLLTTILILAIIIGLQTVGVVLMSTMLIAPAAAARQWTTHLSHMLLLAGFFGGAAALIGVCISHYIEHVPTGPVIVVVASCIVFFSLICAPKRGIAS
jgi:manganese/zinc/iron transport system permease protein